MRRRRRRWVCAFSVMVPMVVLPVSAGDIEWRSGRVETVARSKAELRERFDKVTSQGAARRFVVQFSRPLSKADAAALNQAGLHRLGYLGDNAYFVRVDRMRFQAERAGQLEFIDDLQMIEPPWKLHPFLLDGRVPTWAITDRAYLRDVALAETVDEKASIRLPADPLVAAYVVFHPDVPLMPMGHIRAAMHGGAVISEMKSINALVVEVPYSRLAALASEDDVQYIEPAMPKFSSMNDSSRALVGADVVQGGPYNLDGSGVTVLVYDQGSALTSHPDFGGRLSVRDSSLLLDHSTHVAGTIGGDGTQSSGLYKGFAPGVTMESYGFEQPGGASPGFLFSDPGDLESDYDEAINVHGADIANNSIGSNVALQGYPCEWTGDYGVTSALIDAIVGGSLGAPMRIVWSNGNERTVATCGNQYQTTAPPACAKNHITVGAVNSDNDTMTTFSSWGPSDDGRIKPDVVAPGCQTTDDQKVTSTDTVGGYAGLCGTSMAAPAVTGLGALLLQDYRTMYPALPDFRNSLLKTILTHTAVDLGNTGPDYQFGFGSVRAQPAVDLLRSGSFLETDIDQGELSVAYIEVPPATSELKVTMAWDDAPGTPNVMAALVNDLDLTVVDPGEVIHFPWTLDPENPAVPAVRTMRDRINNIEQVVIDSPPAGLYRIEIRGRSVALGPQSVSLAATPALLTCSSQGDIVMDRTAYRCEDLVVVQVHDCDLNTDDGTIEAVSVNVSSTTEPAGESLLLTETAADSASFQASLPTSALDSAGVLAVLHGDTITATYVDADDGLGGVNINRTDISTTDCVDPFTSSLQVTDVTPSTATIQVDLTEPALVTLNYGTDCLSLSSTVISDYFLTSHEFELTGLIDDTVYFFEFVYEDVAGNAGLDDNGGSCHSFTTDVIVDAFTELYDQGDFDMSNSAMVFEPNGSVDFYEACRVPVSGLPLETTAATTILIPIDAFVEVTLTGGKMISFYGVDYSSFFVGSNGYVTFGSGDVEHIGTFANHFGFSRIAALFVDLDPPAQGRISWEQLSDRAVVTYENVRRFNTTNSNTFQIEMFFSGEIRITWADIDVTDALTGLSKGEGVPVDFSEEDLSTQLTCSPRHPDAPGGVEQVMNVLSLTFNLPAIDDGLPSSPGALSHVVRSLPAGELRDDADGHLIEAADLPYTLNAGNTLLFTPPPAFVGVESFTYSVDDGGIAPKAGSSNIGTLYIDIVDPIPGDVDLSGVVDVFDLLLLLQQWGVCPGCASDFNVDGFVDVLDLVILLAEWGNSLAPPPEYGTGTSVTKNIATVQGEKPRIAHPMRHVLTSRNSLDAFVNDGVLAPADEGGVIEIDRDFVQTEFGELLIELSGTLPVDHHDLLIVQGTATLEGGISIVPFERFTPRPGDRFIVLAADQVQGKFDWQALPEPPIGMRYSVVYLDNAVVVSVERDDWEEQIRLKADGMRPSQTAGRRKNLPVSGDHDLNGDGRVTIADITWMLGEWGQIRSDADLNADGTVDGVDLLTLLDDWIGDSLP